MTTAKLPTPDQARANLRHAKDKRVATAVSLLRKSVFDAMNTGADSIQVALALNPVQPVDVFGMQGVAFSSLQRGYEPPDTYSDVALEAAKTVADEIRQLGWSDVSADAMSIRWSYPPEAAQ